MIELKICLKIVEKNIDNVISKVIRTLYFKNI